MSPLLHRQRVDMRFGQHYPQRLLRSIAGREGQLRSRPAMPQQAWTKRQAQPLRRCRSATAPESSGKPC
ncbi:hypothetical protein Hsero_3756 [Herbaspirillum seropedicae SmR1]|uniref:Uncharacterized protein n=1 Tax=Herbaspirillum seropedicae (strain SmR1) TaxID=757424 RepID=D8IRA8_HERSS|nr:hypothetical protein Hsero_3756 [Herbaspirillum seropedicae SmR1]